MDPEGKGGQVRQRGGVGSSSKRSEAVFPNYALARDAKDEEKVEKRFGLEGGIPYMVMFDKTGKPVSTQRRVGRKKRLLRWRSSTRNSTRSSKRN